MIYLIMTLDFILIYYEKLPTELQTIIIIVAVWVSYKLGLKLPFIPTKIRCHSDCELFPDLNAIIHHAVDKCRRIVIIEEKTTIREQLTQLETKHTQITLRMLEIIRVFKPTHKELREYKKTVSLLEYEIREMQAVWYRENGYAKYTDKDFSEYKREKVDILIKYVGAELDAAIDGYSFSRDDLKRIHEKELIPFAIEQFEKAFDAAREISIKKLEEIDVINKESREVIVA